jgi:hypothetical protein
LSFSQNEHITRAIVEMVVFIETNKIYLYSSFFRLRLNIVTVYCVSACSGT